MDEALVVLPQTNLVHPVQLRELDDILVRHRKGHDEVTILVLLSGIVPSLQGEVPEMLGPRGLTFEFTGYHREPTFKVCWDQPTPARCKRESMKYTAGQLKNLLRNVR